MNSALRFFGILILSNCLLEPAFSGQEVKTYEELKKIVTVSDKISLNKVSEFDGGTQRSLSTDYKVLEKLCWRDEQDYLHIEASILNKWKNAWILKDADKFLALGKNLKLPQFVIGFKKPSRTLGDIKIFSWGPDASKEVIGRDLQKPLIEKYLSQYSKIEDIQFETTKFWSPKGMRDKASLAMDSADLFVRFDVRGLDHDKKRRNDRGQMRMSVLKSQGQWLLDSVELISGETLTTDQPKFISLTETSGIDKMKSYQRLEAIRRGGYGLAMADFDGDGHVDMYVGAYGPGQLFRGNGLGGFEEVKDLDSGLGGETLVKTAIFADLKNSGRQDLLLIRFSPDKKDQGDIVLYENIGKGKFKKSKESFGRYGTTNYAMPATVADFNNDGLLDLYVGFPGARDFTVLYDNQKSIAKGRMVEGLFMNLSDGKFAKGSDRAFKHLETNFSQELYPHSALATDFNNDGKIDIVVIDDRGNLSPSYENLGNGKFALVSNAINAENSGYGMGVAAGDINNDGFTDLVMTNVNFLAEKRIVDSCKYNWDVKLEDNSDTGLRLFVNNGKGKFTESSAVSGIDWAGEGMGGVELLDYNNDGYLDVYVTNGLWSGTAGAEDIGSLFVRARQRNIATMRELRQPLYWNLSKVSGTQSSFMHILQNHKVGKDRLSMAGHQRNRLFQNNGDGTFVEVGFLEGVDSIADGYVVAFADIDENGSMDLVLRNADPGSAAVSFSPVEIFSNQEKKNHSLVIELVGKLSNRDGVGARIHAKIGKREIFRQVNGNNGAAQSVRLVHLGLGNESRVDELSVTWPSGRIDRFKNVPKGRMEIFENKAVDKIGMN